jgi:hypothetical protein
LEPRDKQRTGNVSGSVNKNAVGKGSAGSPLYLPNIAELIEEGQITVGVLRPVRCLAATAHDGHNSLAMLVRRKGETLVELLTRLDLAIRASRKFRAAMAEVLPPNKRTAVLQSGETNPAVRTCSRALFGQVNFEISNGKDEQHAARVDSRLFQAATVGGELLFFSV